jgi:hypothetical protein
MNDLDALLADFSGDELDGVETSNNTALLSPESVSAARAESAEDTQPHIGQRGGGGGRHIPHTTYPQQTHTQGGRELLAPLVDYRPHRLPVPPINRRQRPGHISLSCMDSCATCLVIRVPAAPPPAPFARPPACLPAPPPPSPPPRRPISPSPRPPSPRVSPLPRSPPPRLLPPAPAL